MFTGIVREIGEITDITESGNNKQFTIKASELFTKKPVGASIMVDGVCLTRIDKGPSATFVVEAIQETLNRTIAGAYAKGAHVNLEPSLTLEDDLSGHIVQGHVDDMGTITTFEKNENGAVINIAYPENIRSFIAFKGSITINGISLTVTHVTVTHFEVCIIPHTLAVTNLGLLKEGSRVNLEADVMARYAKRILETQTT